MLWFSLLEATSLAYWNQAGCPIWGRQNGSFSGSKEGPKPSTMRGGEHLEHYCVGLVLFVDVIIERIDDLIEAEGHAVLEVLRMILRVRNASSSSKCRVDLLEQGILEELQ